MITKINLFKQHGNLVLPFFAFIILYGCVRNNSNENRAKKILVQEIKEMELNGVKFPGVQFDIPLADVLADYKKKYKAEGVRVSRPFEYTEKEAHRYWLRVEISNPDKSKPFEEFSKQVASDTYSHLVNKSEYEKIEVKVTSKKGFGVTFSSSRSTFFYRDSL